MPSNADRLEFQPPQAPGMAKAFGIAILAHILLLLALTWGVSWKRESQELAVEAELWSSVPQQAAPKPVEVRPPPAPKVEPRPDPKPVVKEPAIVTEQEKKKPPPPEKKPVEEKKPDPKPSAADLKKQQAAELKKKEEEDARVREKLRQENMMRIAGMAGATGAPSATGTALQSSGPSDSYGGRVRARVKPLIVFSDTTSSNPVAEVEVRSAPDGTIVGTKLVKSSGLKSWDDAVVAAVIKMDTMPKDTNGRVPTPVVIAFRPKD